MSSRLPFYVVQRRRQADYDKEMVFQEQVVGPLMGFDAEVGDASGGGALPIDLFAVEPVDELTAVAPPGDLALSVLRDGMGLPELVDSIPDDALPVRNPERDVALQRILDVLQPVVLAADALQVTNPETCEEGERLFELLRLGELRIHENFDGDCDRAHKVWKGFTERRGTALRGVEGRKGLGDRIASWKADQTRIEREAQQQRERAAREEQDRVAARAATQAERAGDVETAQAIREEAKTAPLPILPAAPSRVPKTGRTVTRTSWEGPIVDLPALLKAIGDRTITEFDVELGLCLQPLLNRLAPTLKGELGKRYPGVEGRQKATLAGR